MSLREVLSIGSVVAVGLATSAHGATVLQLDMSQSDSNFHTFYFNNNDEGWINNVSGSLFMDFFTLGVNGNPGDVALLSHHMEPADEDPINQLLYIRSYVNYNGYQYSPSVSGAISSITFSVDVYLDAPAQIFFNVDQAGTGFSAGNYDIDTVGQYVTVTGTFGPEDFPILNFSGSSPLKFGFGMQTLIENTGDIHVITGYFDNFVVSIETVPEPTALGMLAIGSLALLKYRRR